MTGRQPGDSLGSVPVPWQPAPPEGSQDPRRKAESSTLCRDLVLSEAVPILSPFREIWNYLTCSAERRTGSGSGPSSHRGGLPSVLVHPRKEPGRCVGIRLSIVQKKALNPKMVSSEVVQNFRMEIAYVRRGAAARTQAGHSLSALGSLELAVSQSPKGCARRSVVSISREDWLP